MRWRLPLLVLAPTILPIAWFGVWSQSGPMTGDPLRAQLAVGIPLPLGWLVLASAVGALAARDARTVKSLVTDQEWLRHSIQCILVWSATAVLLIGVVDLGLIVWLVAQNHLYTSPSLWGWWVVACPAPAVVVGSWLVGAVTRSWYGGPLAAFAVSALVFAEAMDYTVLHFLTVNNDMALVGLKAQSANGAIVVGIWVLTSCALLWGLALYCRGRGRWHGAQILGVYAVLSVLVVANRSVDGPDFSLIGSDGSTPNVECVGGAGYSVCGPRGTRVHIEAAIPVLDDAAAVITGLGVPMKQTYYYYTLSNSQADLPTIMVVTENDPGALSDTFDLVAGIAVPRSCPQFKDDLSGPQWLDAASRFSTTVTEVVEGSRQSLSPQEKKEMQALGRALSACDSVPAV